MTTTMCSSKPSPFWTQYCFAMKKILGLDAIYTLLIFFCYPMVYWQHSRSVSMDHMGRAEHYQFNGPVFLSIFAVSALLCFMVLIVSSVLYSYLHNKQSTDFYHSLPVSRRIMLSAHMAAGYTALIVPIWINAFLALLAYPVYLPQIPAREYLYVMGMQVGAWTLGAFVLLAISSLVAVSVSTVVENVGYSAALFLEGSILYGIWILSCVRSFRTYSPAIDIQGSPLYWLSPSFALGYLEALSCMNLLDIDPKLGWLQLWGPLLLWSVLGIGALLGAIWVYDKRQSEHAQQWGRQGVLGFAVKFMAHAMGSFILMLFFSDIMDFGNAASWIAGTLIGGSLGYLVTEVITNHGFQNMKKSLPSMAAATAVMLVFSGYFALGGFGFDERLPKAEDVKSVELDLSQSYSLPLLWYDDIYAQGYENEEDVLRPIHPVYLLKEKENIERVIRLHSEMANNQDTYYYGSTDLTYHKNMGTMRRSLMMSSKGNDTLLEILYSDEFLKNYNPFFALKADYLKGITLHDKEGNNIRHVPKEDAQRLIEAIQMDLMERTPQQVRDTQDEIELGWISFQTKMPREIFASTGEKYRYNTEISFLVLSGDKNTCALMKELGMDFTAPHKKTVNSLYIRSKQHYDDIPQYIYESIGTGGWTDGSDIEITDPDLVEQILSKMSNRNSGYHNQYHVIVGYQGESSDSDGLADEYGEYSIDRSLLMEILKDSEIKVPYILTNEEESQLYGAVLDGDELVQEGLMTWSKDLNLENGVSIKEYAEKYAPQILQGKTQAELEAMERTIYLTADGARVMF